MEKNLIIDSLLISKLERINSPIAKHLLDLRESEQDIENLSINYLGISSENPSFISYLNEDRYEKIKNTNKRAIINFTYTFKDSAFYPPDIDEFNLPADLFNNILYHSEDLDFPKYKKTFNSELVGNFILPSLVYYRDGPEIDLKELLKVKFDEHGLNRFSLWPSNFNYESFLTVRCTIRASKFLDYIDIQDINTMEIYDNDFYNPKLRYHSSIGKLLKKIIPKVDSLYGQKELANFITLFKSESYKELGTNHEFIFEEATEDRILWGYHSANYYEDSNTLGSSCMRYNHCQEYLYIYSENPDKISLGMLLKENKVAARALIWRIGDDVWFDRIYAMDHDAEIILKNHLEGLNMNNCYNEDYKLFVNLKNTYFDYYPYMDTFKYLVKGEGLCSNCNVSYDKELTDVDGNVESRCDCCEHTDCETYEITIGSNRGDYVCTDCGVLLADDEYAMRNNATYCEHSDTHELTRNVTCLFDGTYAHENKTVIAEDGQYYLTDDVEEYCINFEGYWYPFEHSKVVVCDGKYCHEESEEYQDYLLEQQEDEESEEVELQENKTNDEQIKENEQSKEINTIPAEEDFYPFPF
jgi:hypothetical protein